MRRARVVLILVLMLCISCSAYAQKEREQAARQYYEKGMQYYQQGRYKQAQEEFQKALALIPEEQKEPIQPETVTKKKEEIESEEVKRTGAGEYTIDQQDALSISVWEWQDLTADVIVRPDGKISFPLVGDVQAQGKTLTELDEELTERLKEYIKNPQVSVMIKGFGGRKVIVLGEVRIPGVHRTTGRSTIMEVIARAGGLTEEAVLSSIILIRGDLQAPQAQRINLTKVIKKGDLSENIPVEEEDIIYVPRTFIGNIGYFLRQLGPAISAGEFYKRFEDW